MPSPSPTHPPPSGARAPDPSPPSWLPGVLLGLGALLRLRQYATNRSLWQDESSLALSLMDRDFAGLLDPLDYGQMAPAGFLWLEEAASVVLGTGEFALRLVPLLFGLASLPLFDAVARRCLSARGRVVALALFAAAAPLVWYASEVKQYTGDVTLGLAVTALGLETARRGVPARHALALGGLGALAVWFSHGVLFVMAGVGLALGLDALRRRDGGEVLRLGLIALPWAAAVAAFGWLFLRSGADESLVLFWQFAFFPYPPTELADLLWLPERLASMADLSAGLWPPALGALAFAGGVISLAARRGLAAAILGLPMLVVLVASALEIYPFFQRFILFLAPAMLLFAAEAADRCAVWASERLPSGRGSRLARAAPPLVLVAAPLALGLWHVIEPPTRDELRPVLQHVAARARPDDLIWLYHGASRQYAYYAPRVGLGGHESLIGYEPVTDGLYRRWGRWPRLELERLRGRGRVWMVFTNVRSPGELTDEESLLRVFDLHARRIEDVQAPDAAAYLFDLGGGAAREDP